MKQIIKYFKSMSVEDALFFFSMFGLSLAFFGFWGGYLHIFGNDISLWLLIAGLFASAVGALVLLVRKDAFIHDIED